MMIFTFSVLSLTIISILMAQKTVKEFTTFYAEMEDLEQRVIELERALVIDECTRGEFKFTTRKPAILKGDYHVD